MEPLFTRIKHLIKYKTNFSLQRERQKNIGYMWSGKVNLVLKNNQMYIFDLWHHFFEDDGKNWKPSNKQLESLWRAKFVKFNEKTNPLDATWHLLYTKKHIYMTEKGFFPNFDEKQKDEIIKKIKSGEWKTDKDIKLII